MNLMTNIPAKRTILRMSIPQRDLILRHMECDQPVRAADSKVCRNALVRRGMLLLLPPNSSKPRYTSLSSIGKYAAAVLLIEYREILERTRVIESSGAPAESPMEVLRRLKASNGLKRPEMPVLGPGSGFGPEKIA
jgi:hypothetical protein